MAFPKTIKHRRGLAIEWETKNPILKDGEFGVDLDSGNFKLGNGVLHWKELPYFLSENDIETVKGDKGDTGETGPAPILEFSGETGDPGSEVQTLVIPIAGGYSVVFTIPRGIDGYQGIDGVPGEQGPPGIQGVPGPQGPPGLEGPQGVKGDTGNPGTSLTIVDQVPTVHDLPESAPPSDGYLTDSGSLYFYGVSSGWVEVGYLRGPEGPQGIQGVQGPQGEPGPIGPEGSQGIQGVPGNQGPLGNPGPAGPAPTPTSHIYTTTNTVDSVATVNASLIIAKIYTLMSVGSNQPARIRFYTDEVSRLADSSRAHTDEPSPSVGVVLDVLTSLANPTVMISPSVLGTCASSSIPLAITNLSGSTQSITVTVHALVME